MSKLIWALLLSAMVWIAPPAARADNEAEPAPPRTLEDLDRQLADAFAGAHVPGASVAVIENGEIVFIKAYGVSDKTANTPVVPDTVFRIGSISKTFLAIGTMMLVEEGRLSLDARLHDLAPEIKFHNPWEATEPVRYVHLLEHTTGWEDLSIQEFMIDAKGWTLQQGIEAGGDRRVSRWAPGHYSIYSNAGPGIAGYVVEKIAGRPYAEFLRERVIRPLGMATADIEITPALQPRLSKSYNPDGSEARFMDIIMPPAGSMASDARELARLVQFFLGRGTIDGRQLLTEASIDRIEHQETTDAARAGLTTGYGLGNYPEYGDGIAMRGHGGNIDGFSAFFAYWTGHNSGYVVLLNGGDANAGAPALVQQYLARDFTPVLPDAYPVAAAELERFAGFYQSITPRSEFFRIFEDLIGVQPIEFADGALAFNGRARVPVAPNVFRREDRAEASTVFIETASGDLQMLGGDGALQRVPLWKLALKVGVMGLLILCTLSAIVLLPFWVVAWIRGRLARRGGFALRVVPLLSVLALVTALGLGFYAMIAPGTDALNWMAKSSPYAWTIFIGSILFPLLAALGLWRALKTRGAGRFVRIHAGLTSALVLVAAVYASTFGWVGMQVWNW